MDDHAYQQNELARIIGKSPATISVSLSLNKLPKEIQDECRQDPAVPKSVLIEITRKKQERGMLGPRISATFSLMRYGQIRLTIHQT